MSSMVTVQEAQARLEELIARLEPGDEMVITKNDVPVARLVAEGRVEKRERQPGSAVGKFFVHTEDDEHLEDFEEYMR
ncbi:MAG TPA: type II toxin-antitoxin system prevent-host-death family antitoxin [Blastocatellia bacterium]